MSNSWLSGNLGRSHHVHARSATEEPSQVDKSEQYHHCANCHIDCTKGDLQCLRESDSWESDRWVPPSPPDWSTRTSYG